MTNKEEFANIIQRFVTGRKNQKQKSKDDVRKIEQELAVLDKSLDFATKIGAKEEIDSKKEKIDDYNLKLEEIEAVNEHYDQKLEELKTLASFYSTKRIENASEKEIELSEKQHLNTLKVKAAALNEEKNRLKRELDRIALAREINLADADEARYQKKIEDLLQKYLKEGATDLELEQGKLFQEKVYEVRESSKERMSDYHHNLTEKEVKIEEELRDLEENLRIVEEEMNKISAMDLESYRKHLIENTIIPEKMDKEVEDRLLLSKRKFIYKLADGKMRYQAEALIRKYESVSYAREFTPYLIPNDYKKNSHYQKPFKPIHSLSNEEIEELKEALLKDVEDFDKNEQLESIGASALPTLEASARKGWLKVPINFDFFEKNTILEGIFKPSAYIRNLSLELDKLQNNVFNLKENKEAIVLLERKISEKLKDELCEFIANQITDTYLAKVTITKREVVTNEKLAHAIDEILDNNAKCKDLAEKLLERIEEVMHLRKQEIEDKENIALELAELVKIEPDILEALLENKIITSNTIAKECTLKDTKTTNKKKKEVELDHYMSYLDTLTPEQLLELGLEDMDDGVDLKKTA